MIILETIAPVLLKYLGIIQPLHNASRREGGYQFLLWRLMEIALQGITRREGGSKK